jgi:hypothetical protein
LASLLVGWAVSSRRLWTSWLAGSYFDRLLAIETVLAGYVIANTVARPVAGVWGREAFNVPLIGMNVMIGTALGLTCRWGIIWFCAHTSIADIAHLFRGWGA